MNDAFHALGIRPELTDALRKHGVTLPTPVQAKSIPYLLSGRDVFVQSQTGTGKTAAFVLPILQNIDAREQAVQALIITPTRELAIQITEEIKKLAPAVGSTVLAVYGGQDVEGQIRKLKGATHIVVATPGRLLDHLRRDTIQLSRVARLVIDEADQMLDMGFLPEVEEILRQTPASRQTMLFSATLPDSVRRLAKQYLGEPADIRIQGSQITLEGIKQFVIETTDRAKQQALIHRIEQDRPFLAVVFCRTKIRAKKLTEALLAHGMNVDELHGDLSQAKRELVMKRFRSADLQILVATDVAARGLDVEGITHVYNYDIPLDAESYIHRTGRTGRAGKKGTAVTFVAPKDRSYLQRIEQGIGTALERRSADLPGLAPSGWREPDADGPKRAGKTDVKKDGRGRRAQARTGQRADSRQQRKGDERSSRRNENSKQGRGGKNRSITCKGNKNSGSSGRAGARNGNLGARGRRGR
ncbi:DEAD/DEAH box helicase [Ferviditalea candida]|uniref:RNA helicase n=1 Tax=Ferviditalea candida TaxID=3108399 RepID=A0ABU5ZIJ3_9BACL|nr:DEAD/DEAH box helicase [Paenibacillaceae bacterium T2]